MASPEQAKPASQSPSPTESTPPPPVIKDSQRPSKEDSPKADAPHVTAEVDPPKKTDVIESKHEVHVSLASSDGMPIEAGDSFWMYLRDGTRADLKNVRNNLKTVLRPGDYGSSVGIIEKNRLKFQFNPERPVLAILKQGGRTLSYYVDTNCYSVITTKWTHVESHRFHLGGFAVFLTNIASKCEVHMMMGKDRQQVLPNPIRGTEVELESAVKKQRGRLVAQLKEELEGKLRPYRKIRDDIKEALPVYLELCRSRQLDDKDREKLDQTEDKLKDAVRRACEMEDIARAFANKDNKPCSKVFTGFDERLKKSPNQDDAQRKAKSCLMSIRGWKGDHNQQVHPHLRGFFNYDFDFQKEEWSRAVLASTEVGIAAIEAEHRSNQPDRMPCEIVFSLPDVGPIAVYHLPK
ncbi:MAG: hypothetical protein FJ280_09300 [Planctomycetes bacterium]|nr:hypothetical protein [Planctomycetota bacterium]